MAVKSDGSALRYRPIRVAISEIEPDDANARQRIDPQKIELLAQSMRGVGQLQPVLLRENLDAGAGQKRYRLRGGSRRRAAALLLGWTEIDAVVMPAETAGPGVSAVVALVDNLQREQLSGYEQAQAFRALVNDGKLTCAEIARLAGVSISQVSNQLLLLDRLAPPILEQWRGGHPLLTAPRMHAISTINDAAGAPDHAAQIVVWERVVAGTVRSASKNATEAERRIAAIPDRKRLQRDIARKLRAFDRWFVWQKRRGADASCDPHEMVRYLLGEREAPPVNIPYKEKRQTRGNQRANQGECKTDLRRAAGRAVFEGDSNGPGQVPG